MLNKKEIVEIEKTLARFQEGDLYSPVRSWGFGEYHAICTMLESLRLSMLKLKDGIAETSTKTNKTIASVAHDMKTPLTLSVGIGTGGESLYDNDISINCRAFIQYQSDTFFYNSTFHL